MKDNVILTGFMGCGKTSVGIRLSYSLKWPMTDTDKWIEKRQGMSVSHIFAAYGEAAFRQMETDCLKELTASLHHQVVATGGGLPIKEENHALLRELGRVYYLKVSPETVYERLKGDTTRPLLQGPDPRKKIEQLLAERAPLYEKCADVIIDVSGKTFEEIIEEIMQKERGR
jgi:shikimate kinase